MESERTNLLESELDEPEVQKETNENEDSLLPAEIQGIKDTTTIETTRKFSLVSSTEEDEDQEKSQVPKHPYGDNYDPITANHIQQTAIQLGIIKLSWPPLDTMSFER